MNNEDRNRIAKQHCNKLIAEFMGAVGTPKYNPTEWDVYITGCLDVDSDDENAQHFYTPDEMKYDTSWDWLMPVLKKITIGKLNPSNYRKWRMINTPTEYNIEEVYKAVVRFIKKYNDGKQ
tara:strand:+ start:84 stop:446 length:363 start_codon:yes stop_codon:yes gene_type:complete